jgi:hypothetical protein
LSQSLLYGGHGNDDTRFFDTWLWNGTDWTMLPFTSRQTPNASNGNPMAWDGFAGRMILGIGTTWVFQGMMVSSLSDLYEDQHVNIGLATINGTAPYAYSVVPGAGSLPPGLTLSSAGLLSGTPTTIGIYRFAIRSIDSSSPPNRATRTYLLRIRRHVVLSDLPRGTADRSYSANVVATGGISPYTYAIDSGAPPPGLTLHDDGSLTGTPTTAGTFPFHISATDSDSPANVGIRDYSLAIHIGLGPLPNAVLNQPYQHQITATGGNIPYTFAVSSGALPPGLQLDVDTVKGTPTAAGSFTFTVHVVDSNSPMSTGNRTYTIKVT